MTDLHEPHAAGQSSPIVGPGEFTARDSRLSELATLTLELLEARLATCEETTATVNDVVDAAFGESHVDIARVGEAILACLPRGPSRSVTAPGG